MRNNAPVEHCVAEAFILYREIVLTMKNKNIAENIFYCSRKYNKSFTNSDC